MSTIKAGVIGHPIAHSLSPLIHNYWLRQHGIDATYDAVDIAPENLRRGIDDMIARGYRGFNVTIPHKQAVMSLCDSIDETAQRIGAVNTVVVREGGVLHGMNTDSYGFVENIRQTIRDIDLQGKAALVLGAGGAARAIVHGLLALGIGDIRLANRTREKAQDIAADFPVQVIDWESRAAAAADIAALVNTTALGMAGQPALEFDMGQLPTQALVCDIVYRPLQTDLLKTAAQRGNQIVTGIGMLLHQARPAFREWFGVLPEVDAQLQQKILEELK